jgi:hypothetical protein
MLLCNFTFRAINCFKRPKAIQAIEETLVVYQDILDTQVDVIDTTIAINHEGTAAQRADLVETQSFAANVPQTFISVITTPNNDSSATSKKQATTSCNAAGESISLNNNKKHTKTVSFQPEPSREQLNLESLRKQIAAKGPTAARLKETRHPSLVGHKIVIRLFEAIGMTLLSHEEKFRLPDATLSQPDTIFSWNCIEASKEILVICEVKQHPPHDPTTSRKNWRAARSRKRKELREQVEKRTQLLGSECCVVGFLLDGELGKFVLLFCEGNSAGLLKQEIQRRRNKYHVLIG